MEIKLLKGGTERLRLNNKRLRIKEKCKSKFQHEVGQRLIAKYAYDMIFEEIQIRGDKLVLDFFIPSMKLVIECHGKQHTEHVKHFHKTKRDFHNQQDRDSKMREWCKLNNFRLVEVFYDDWKPSTRF